MMRTPSIRIVYFSYSGQVKKLVDSMAQGLEEAGVETVRMKLRLRKQMPFPLNSFWRALALMVRTFFRERFPVKEGGAEGGETDLVILGGPTWSFNPSGPLLSYIDTFGCSELSGKRVLPLISCRTYWKGNARVLARMAKKCGSTPLPPVVFTHPIREPWRSLGVFLVLAGKRPENLPVIKKYYQSYGHSKAQLVRAKQIGKKIGRALVEGEDIGEVAAWLHGRWIEHGTP